ncbi:MAG TPA: caspase family protein [Oculatellaceae cyanobacterium]
MRTRSSSILLTSLFSITLASQALAGIDQTFVGKWVMPHADQSGTINWYWFVKPDGSYASYANGKPGGLPTEVGRFTTAGNTYNLHALSGRLDDGTYTWLDKDHVKMSGNLGTGVWSRMNATSAEAVSGLEKQFVGQWKMRLVDQFGSKDIHWNIQPDGSYSLFFGNVGNYPDEAGKVQANDGKWSLAVPGGRTDQGSYTWKGRDQVEMTGFLGTGTWERISATPIESHPATAVSAPLLPASALSAPIKDKWAVVVGINKFADKSIPQLRYCAKDAQDFAEYLVKDAHFAPDHIRVLLNEKATRKEIMSEVGDKFLPRVVKPDDLVVFYFSSHGSPSKVDIRNAYYLVAYDTEKTDLYATGIDMKGVLTELMQNRVKANRVLVILDACHSGGADTNSKDLDPAKDNFSINQLGRGQLLISSCSPDQRSWESKRYENGVFTHQLINALRAQGIKTNVQDAFNRMKSGVADEVQQDFVTSQTPGLKNDTWHGSDLQVGITPTSPQPLPREVSSLLPADSRGSK